MDRVYSAAPLEAKKGAVTSLYVELMDCPSKAGTFEIDDGNDAIYHVPPVVMSFTCAN